MYRRLAALTLTAVLATGFSIAGIDGSNRASAEQTAQQMRRMKPGKPRVKAYSRRRFVCIHGFRKYLTPDAPNVPRYVCRTLGNVMCAQKDWTVGYITARPADQPMEQRRIGFRCSPVQGTGAASLPKPKCPTGFSLANFSVPGLWCESQKLRCAANYFVSNTGYTGSPVRGRAVIRYTCKRRR